jgi:hypothetical protein
MLTLSVVKRLIFSKVDDQTDQHFHRLLCPDFAIKSHTAHWELDLPRRDKKVWTGSVITIVYVD